MQHKRPYFSGRIVFHHQPKTAGQSVNAWLLQHLGAGSVTPNLIGQHRELIRLYGGEYPVLSGHLDFDGSGLDSHYLYLSILREPVDRFISWLYYVIHDADTTDHTRALKAGAQLFLTTEGRESNDTFLESANNVYVENFRKAVMLAEAPAERKLNAACAVAEAYDLLGFYEELPQFVENLAGLIDLKQFSSLPSVNVTSQRKSVAQISPALRKSVEALTDLDREFYRRMLGRAHAKTKSRRKVRAPIRSFPFEQRSWAFPSTPIRPSWAAGYLCQFDACAFSSQNGTVDGTACVSNGKAGYLVYGGGLGLDPGRYQAAIPCAFETEGAMVIADAAYDRGQSVLTNQSVCDYGLGAGNFSASLSLNLQAPVLDLEFRLWVPARHVVRCRCVYIIDEDALEAHRKSARERFIDSTGPGACANKVTSFEPLALFTGIGTRTEATLQTQGTAGILSFGPYVPLARGKWWVALVGLVGPQGLDGAWVDVSFSRGQKVVHKETLAIPPFNDETLFIGQPWSFTLEQDVEDLEIRVFVGARSQVSLAQILLMQMDEAPPQPNSLEEDAQDA